MINNSLTINAMKDIETRLKQFLVYKKIDSCRNMNEFVQTVEKLAEFSNLFPDLNADWLINGRGIQKCRGEASRPGA